MLPPPPTSTLFPYTTLFRSADAARNVIELQLVTRTPCDVVIGARSVAAHADRTDEFLARVVQRESAAEDVGRSEEHTSELQSRPHLVCRLLLEKKKKNNI